MKIYIDDKDIGTTITYKQSKENGIQYLYVHDKEGFIIGDLLKFKREFVSQLCDEISSAIAYEVFVSEKLTHVEIEKAIEKVRNNLYGIRR